MKLISCMIGGGTFEFLAPSCVEARAVLGDPIDQIERAFNRARRSYGIDPTKRREWLSHEEAEGIKSVMHSDVSWQTPAERIVRCAFGDSNRVLEKPDFKAITIPWWNEVVFGLSFPLVSAFDDITNFSLPVVVPSEGIVRLKPNAWHVMHSYAVMLQRKLTGFQGGRRTCIVGALTFTSDGKIIVGERGGEYQPGFLSTVPGGSMGDPSDKQSLLHELEQELFIQESDLAGPPSCVAIVEFDDTRVLVSSILQLRIHSSEIHGRWEQARDKWEHRDVQCIPCDPGQPLVSYAQEQYERLTGKYLPFMPLAAGVFTTAAAALFKAENLLHFFSNDEEIRAYL